MSLSARIPDPYVVTVHRRGDVRYCALSQYIAKCRELIQAGKFDEIEGLASAHEFGQQARDAIGAARKLLPWKQPAATEAAAAKDEKPVCMNCMDTGWEPGVFTRRVACSVCKPAAVEAAAATEKCPGCKTPLTRSGGGTFCFNEGCIFYVNADSGDRNTTDQNIPVTGTGDKAMKALDSITCLVVEGPDVMPSADIVRRIKAIVEAYANESDGVSGT